MGCCCVRLRLLWVLCEVEWRGRESDGVAVVPLMCTVLGGV